VTGVLGRADLGNLAGRCFPAVSGVDRVEESAIRRFTEALEWDEPIHSDAAAAAAAGHRGLVAPTASHTMFAMPAYWSPGDPPADPGDPPQLPRMAFFAAFPPGSRTVNLGFRRDCLDEVTVGDRVSCGYEIRTVKPTVTRVGAGSLVEVCAYYAADGERQVSVGTFRLLNYVPGDAARGAARRGAARSEDGAALARFGITHTPQRLAMWAGANRDFAPWHHDRAYARAGGAPDMFANTFFIEALYERLLRSIAGSRGAVRSIDFEIKTFLCPAPTIDVRATHAEQTPDGDGLVVAIRQSVAGVTTSVGHGVVTVGAS
jgi:acyl dehydratase